jgi:hypothetical protein
VSLIKCPDCDHDVSDEASVCIHCGRPLKSVPGKRPALSNAWDAVTRSRTPINVFALAMMACAAVLGASSTQIDNVCDLTAFTYTLHIFLALCGMFFATVLFSRRGIYHPADLAKAKQSGMLDLGRDHPVVAAVFICLMVAGYTGYRVYVHYAMAGVNQDRVSLTECINHPIESKGGKRVSTGPVPEQHRVN